MKAAQIGKPGGDFELVEREIPGPGARQVRVKVEACGICHSDVLVKEGLWPGLQFPRVPGYLPTDLCSPRSSRGLINYGAGL
jgi:D-arabinose 1-dehydrogenase-like Zn-dependent alcohol dehydrogenase